MNNFIIFFNQFLEYIILFVVSVIAIMLGCFVGIKWRKSKNMKEVLLAAQNDNEQ